MGYSARNMSDQRRSDLAQPPVGASASATRFSGFGARSGIPTAWLAGLRKRLPFYALGIAIALAMLAWIDGGEEPLHPIAQSVELNPATAEAD
jgi:hypothetical protein